MNPSAAHGSTGSRPAVSLPKTPSGIAGFDDLTFGGLPTGRPTLLCGSAGCGTTLMAMTFLVDGATRFGETDRERVLAGLDLTRR